MPSVSDAVTLDGKLFQMHGAATKNARSPIVERRNDGVTRADVDAECSHLFALMSFVVVVMLVNLSSGKFSWCFTELSSHIGYIIIIYHAILAAT